MDAKAAAIAGGLVLLLVGAAAALLVGGDEPPPELPVSGRELPTKSNPGPGGGGSAGPTPTGGGPSVQPDPGPGDPGPVVGGGTPDTRPDPRPDPRADPRVTPDAPGSISVTLVCLDERGQPLPGVWVEPMRGLPGRQPAPLPAVLSDGQGRAEIRPLASGDVLEGVARHPLSTRVQQFGPLHLRRSAEVRLEFEREATGMVRGRILDDQGAPVREAELILTLPSLRQAGRADAEAVLDSLAMGLNANGEYLATMAAGEYALAARGPGLAKSELIYLSVPAGGEVQAQDLVVDRQGVVRGTLSLPPEVARVLPLELNLALEVTQRAESDTPYVREERRPIQVDASHTFELAGCDPGDYKLRLELEQVGGNRVGPWVRFKIQAGQVVDGVTLVLTEVSDGMTGIVRDDRGYELEGASVTLRGRTVQTNARGEYALMGLDPGELTLRVEAPGHAGVTQRFAYSGGRGNHDVSLDRLGGVRGEVRSGGAPAARVVVYVCHRQAGIVRPHQVTTGEDGTFELVELPPGDYFFKVGRGASYLDDTGAPSLIVRPGEVSQAPPLDAP
jgi:Carboxypeptidase regulatory-like domain